MRRTLKRIVTLGAGAFICLILSSWLASAPPARASACVCAGTTPPPGFTVCQGADAVAAACPSDTVPCGNNNTCQVSSYSCKQDSDCEQYGGGSQVGPQKCYLNICYLDQTRLERANSQPGIFGIKATLNIQKPQTEIAIPGMTFTDVQKTLDSQGYIHLPYLGEYVAAVYKFGVAVASIVAVVVIIMSGLRIVASAGGEAKGEAYKRIAQAVIGLIIAWGSYLLLFAINPDLINFKPLSIKYIEPQDFPERNTEDRPDKTGTPNGLGDPKTANDISCPKLEAGAQFTGAFTTYLDLSEYGKINGYNNTYVAGSDPTEDADGLGDFFCAVQMECGCPGGKTNQIPNACKNSKGRTWPGCKFFDKNTPFCTKGNKKAGVTVAASTCFPIGSAGYCDIQVGNHAIRPGDRGGAIIGTHFDLYLGKKGEPDFVNDTSWLQTNLTIKNCVIKDQTVFDNQKTYMQKKYGSRCRPGDNC